MKIFKILIFALLAILILSACSSTKPNVKYSLTQSTSTVCSVTNKDETSTCQNTSNLDSMVTPTQVMSQQPDLTRSDTQGAVTIDVTPLNLAQPSETLMFDVSMNTHSVDLSMDLAQLSTLTTDTGKTIQASLWEAPKGGHHIEGKLSFPVIADGKNLLDGASSITLTINNIDSQSRTFTWQLSK